MFRTFAQEGLQKAFVEKEIIFTVKCYGKENNML